MYLLGIIEKSDEGTCKVARDILVLWRGSHATSHTEASSASTKSSQYPPQCRLWNDFDFLIGELVRVEFIADSGYGSKSVASLRGAFQSHARCEDQYK